ncbi:hypothetical protein [Bailinhaonella thermotolerans]|uniref:Uncharacterized protein n=1 Tax=Bailinhaonella thermotolerans TaxID=1070861 RepID=A0A3A4AIK5_9ACTN|nr:hypothetical protein [Bailinhaonella thermotolerans]RJL26457.1 hypothetical protein D5H75_26065 [Bailinhaonella thermotolerans]
MLGSPGRTGRGVPAAVTLAGLLLAASAGLPWVRLLGTPIAAYEHAEGRVVLACGLVAAALGAVAVAGSPRLAALAAAPGLVAAGAIVYVMLTLASFQERIDRATEGAPEVGELAEELGPRLTVWAFLALAAAVAVTALALSAAARRARA